MELTEKDNVMTGIAVHGSDIDSVMAHWEFSVYLSKKYSLQKMKFVVFCVDDKPVLAGKISAITCYPNAADRPYLIYFSELVADPVMHGIDVGTARNEIVLLKTADRGVDVPIPSFEGGISKPKQPSFKAPDANSLKEQRDPFCD